MLTKTEQTVYKLNAVGKSYKEMADILTITMETVKSHMKNLKVKKGLQKSAELAALYWCEVFGASFEEQRKRIIESCVTAGCIAIIAIITLQPNCIYRRPERRRCARIEFNLIEMSTEYASAA